MFQEVLHWIATLPTEAWIGFGGVILGGIISAASTSYFARSELRKLRKSEAISVALKASLIASEFNVLHEEIKAAAKNYKKQNNDRRPLWSYWTIKTGRRERIKIEPDHLLAFIEAHEYEVVENLLMLDMRHKAVCDGLNEFVERKYELRSRIGNGVTTDQLIGASPVEPDELSGILMLEMTTIFESMERLLPTFSAEARALCERLTPLLRRHLKDTDIPYFFSSSKPPRS